MIHRTPALVGLATSARAKAGHEDLRAPQTLGAWQTQDRRPLIKPTPANIRAFAKTPYARRGV